LPRLRLPVGQQIADIDAGFQFGLFVVGQLTLIGADIEFFNPGGVILREVKREMPSARAGVIPWPGKSNTRRRTSA